MNERQEKQFSKLVPIDISSRVYAMKKRHQDKGTLELFNEKEFIDFLKKFIRLENKRDMHCDLCFKDGCAPWNAKGRRSFHVGHIIPISKGGPTCKENLCILCDTCNYFMEAKSGSELYSMWDNIKLLLSQVYEFGRFEKGRFPDGRFDLLVFPEVKYGWEETVSVYLKPKVKIKEEQNE